MIARLFTRREPTLAKALEAKRQRAAASKEVNMLMLVEACRAMPAGEVFAAMLAEAQSRPDVSPEMAETYGNRLYRLADRLRRGGA